MRARDRSGREYAEARKLNEATAAAVDEALRLVDGLAADERGDLAVDVEFASSGDAVFARKRLNEALAMRELLDEIDAWVWQADRHQTEPITAAGAARGFELRIRRRRAT